MHIILPSVFIHLDKDMQRGPEPLSHRQPHHSYVNSQGIPHPLQHSPPSGAGNPYPHSVQPSAAYLRRGSVEFGSSSDGSHDSPTTAEQSIPSSATSSNVHLPLDNLSMQQSQPLPFNVSPSSSVAISCFSRSFPSQSSL